MTEVVKVKSFTMTEEHARTLREISRFVLPPRTGEARQQNSSAVARYLIRKYGEPLLEELRRKPGLGARVREEMMRFDADDGINDYTSHTNRKQKTEESPDTDAGTGASNGK